MDKPSGICIYPKDHIDEAYYVRTTDINEAIQYFTSEYGYGFDLAEMSIEYFFECPFDYVYKSDLFEE